MKYTSKLGIFFVIFIIIIMGGISISMILDNEWSGLFVNFIVFGFIYYLYNATFYLIEDETLTVKSSVLVNEEIDINTISKISETNNPYSAPAFSLDRLNIRYGKSGTILISPKDKEKFINHLKSINPNIEINYKK